MTSGATLPGVRSGGVARRLRSDSHTIRVCATGHTALTRMSSASRSSAHE